MTTERELLTITAKACGVVKPWLERLPSRLPLTQQACTLVQTSCKQAEIDELRSENTRLRDVLRHLAETHAWLAFGECRAFGTDTLLTSAEADKVARAALGEKK